MPTRPALHWHPDRSPDGRQHDRWFVAAPEYPPYGGVWRELGRYRVVEHHEQACAVAGGQRARMPDQLQTCNQWTYLLRPNWARREEHTTVSSCGSYIGADAHIVEPAICAIDLRNCS